MSVDLNKGATVELVKMLSDDLRTRADGTKASSAGEAVRSQIGDLEDAISQIDADVELTPVDVTYELASVEDIDTDVELTPVDVSYELALAEDIPEGGGSIGGLAFDSGYQDAQGYIHLTKNGVDLPSSSFTPFKVSAGGDAETITAINAI